MWQGPYLCEQLQIHCATVLPVQYVVPWYSTCLHGNASTVPQLTATSISKKKAYSDIFLLAHEYTDKNNVSVGSVNGFIYSVVLVDLVWEIFFTTTEFRIARS
jgi:hypothetical protein